MAPIMRAPELTAPGSSPSSFLEVYLPVALVGEISYDSIVTKRAEPLPIAVSVIGAPGMRF